MRWYQPQTPFNVAATLLIPETTRVSGTRKTIYPETGPLIFCNFRTFGGSENWNNNVFTVIATGTVETWYRPDIKADCRIRFEDTGEVYDIINEPEDIGMRHQFMQFKVQKVGGKA